MANSFLRITAPGWATFTGNFGGVNFIELPRAMWLP